MPLFLIMLIVLGFGILFGLFALNAYLERGKGEGKTERAKENESQVEDGESLR